MNADWPCAAISRKASSYACTKPAGSSPDRMPAWMKVSDSPQLAETPLAMFWLAAVKNASANP